MLVIPIVFNSNCNQNKVDNLIIFLQVDVVPRRGCNDTHYSKLNIVNMVDSMGNSPLIEACKVR